jgi:hypothetical protein
MGLTVFARPDRLQHFRLASAEAADDLARRASALDSAVGAYLRATERAYEAPCASAPQAVDAYAGALRGLGAWVGRVGDAFDDVGVFGGRRFISMDRLTARLPIGLRLGTELPVAGTLVAAEAVIDGAHPRDLRAVALVFGTGTAAAATVAAAADGPVGRSLGRYLDFGAAVSRGASESEARWRSEPHLDLPERFGRAALDGVVAAGGTYAGSAGGIALGGWACSPLGPPVQAVCAAAGARAGSAVGGAIAETVSDTVLGPEPAPPPSPRDGIPLVTGQIDAAADAVTAAADAHADFVLERPWLWDDEFADAPSHPHPVVPPQVPPRSAGPR